MTENSRIAREYRRLTSHMNAPLVDENLYLSSLRNKDILMILDVVHLTTKITKQRNLISLLDVVV